MVRAWRLVAVLATHSRVRRCFTQSHLAAAQTMRRIVAAAALGCMIASTDAFGGGCLVPLRRGPAAATAGLRMQAGAQEVLAQSSPPSLSRSLCVSTHPPLATLIRRTPATRARAHACTRTYTTQHVSVLTSPLAQDPAAVMARVNQMMAGKPSAAASTAAPVAPADVAPIQADPVDAVLARTASMMRCMSGKGSWGGVCVRLCVCVTCINGSIQR